jgi:Ras family protein T1
VVLVADRQEDKIKMEMECKKADAIVLTYSCDRPQTLDRLSSYWLPELRRLEVSVSCLRATWNDVTVCFLDNGGMRLIFFWKYVMFSFLYLVVLVMQIKVPVIVVGCKLDLRDDSQSSLEQVMAPLMQEFREIETCIECSALKQIQVLLWKSSQLES